MPVGSSLGPSFAGSLRRGSVRRRLVPLAAVLAVGAGAVLAGGAPADATVTAGAARSAVTTLAPGVTYWRDSWVNGRGHTVRAVLLQAKLGAHVALQARTPGQSIGLPRQPLSALVKHSGAIAGVNGDFFDLFSDASPPRGGVINNGRVLKSPRPGRLSNLYVRSDGHAAIGAIPYAYSLTRAATSGRRAVTHAIFSLNSPDDAVSDHLVFINPTLAGGRLDRGCEVVTGHLVKGVNSVTALLRARSVSRPVSGAWALAGCGSTADWLRANLRVRDRVTLTLAYPKGKPVTAIGGRRELVRNGRAYDDPTGSELSTWGPNPETFGCVSKDGLTVLLGAVDGRIRTSAGVTYDQLTSYLLRLKCWSGVVFDGGGSTEMVAKLPGSSNVSVLNTPAAGAERNIPDALVVVTK
jgi:hypothetical protein